MIADADQENSEGLRGPPDHNEKTESEVVWAHYSIFRSCTHDHTEDGVGRQKRRETTKEKMGRQLQKWTGLSFTASQKEAESRENRWEGISKYNTRTIMTKDIYIYTQHTHSYFLCSFLYCFWCRFIYNFMCLQKSGQLIQLAVALHHSVISDVVQYDRLTPMFCPCPITATLINPGVGPCPSVLIILRQSRLHAHSPANLVKTMGDLRTIHL